MNHNAAVHDLIEANADSIRELAHTLVGRGKSTTIVVMLARDLIRRGGLLENCKKVDLGGELMWFDDCPTLIEDRELRAGHLQKYERADESAKIEYGPKKKGRGGKIKRW